MFEGCHTALATPMREDAIDYNSLVRLVEFQVHEGVKGIVVMGTTGESPTITEEEYRKVISRVLDRSNERCLITAGTGCSSTRTAIHHTSEAYDIGIRCALVVDPYYNGPSSLEIRKEYLEPLAEKFPNMDFIPYIIPGRTGTKLMPHDLAILHSRHHNVNAVKEATGDFENMKMIRKLCGEDFHILSGDDDKTYAMMTDKAIKAEGVISVASNIAPRYVQEMVATVRRNEIEQAESIAKALQPLFRIITVKTIEETPLGSVECKARNPLPIKTLMNILGMPSGKCRPPLGKMTRQGIEILRREARLIYENNPEILHPVEEFFEVDMEERLFNERFLDGLYYERY